MSVKLIGIKEGGLMTYISYTLDALHPRHKDVTIKRLPPLMAEEPPPMSHTLERHEAARQWRIKQPGKGRRTRKAGWGLIYRPAPGSYLTTEEVGEMCCELGCEATNGVAPAEVVLHHHKEGDVDVHITFPATGMDGMATRPDIMHLRACEARVLEKLNRNRQILGKAKILTPKEATKLKMQARGRKTLAEELVSVGVTNITDKKALELGLTKLGHKLTRYNTSRDSMSYFRGGADKTVVSVKSGERQNTFTLSLGKLDEELTEVMEQHQVDIVTSPGSPVAPPPPAVLGRSAKGRAADIKADLPFDVDI